MVAFIICLAKTNFNETLEKNAVARGDVFWGSLGKSGGLSQAEICGSPDLNTWQCWPRWIWGSSRVINQGFCLLAGNPMLFPDCAEGKLFKGSVWWGERKTSKIFLEIFSNSSVSIAFEGKGEKIAPHFRQPKPTPNCCQLRSGSIPPAHASFNVNGSCRCIR